MRRSRRMRPAQPHNSRILFSSVLILTMAIEVLCQSSSLFAQKAGAETRELQRLIVCGDSLRSIGEYRAAQKAYKNALKINEKSVAAYIGLQKIAYEERDWGDVKEWSKKILEVLPEDPEANYHLGIAYRETGKTKNAPIKSKQFGWSEDCFSEVIAADSTFRDVLYQRGLLERWRENWEQALSWARRQIALKPDLATAHVGLVNLCRLYLSIKGQKEGLIYLKNQKDPWAHYMIGEVYRQEERFARADSIFQSLLQTESPPSKTPVLLSLVRMALQSNSEAAGSYFNWSLDSMKTEIDAAFMFEDAKYIFRDSELEIYQGLNTAKEKCRFFYRFWNSRNPVPAASINPRAIEHFRRMLVAEESYLFYGVRSWFTDPNKTGYRSHDLPASFLLNARFNDKGLIYIRYGEPDRRALSTSEMSSYESWKYAPREDHPELILHFTRGATGVENNWRLSIFPMDARILESLIYYSAGYDPERLFSFSIRLPGILEQIVGWNPKLDRFILSAKRGTRSRTEFATTFQDLTDESKAMIYYGLSTDRHTWNQKTKFMHMPYQLVSFKGPEGFSRIAISYALPISALFQEGTENVVLSLGTAVYDTLSTEVNKVDEQLSLDRNSPYIFQDYFIYSHVLEISPGRYKISLYSDVTEANKIAGWNFQTDVPSFGNRMLSLSDIELAYEVSLEPRETQFERRNLAVVPNPVGEFSRQRLAHIYYEIYNLRRDGNGNAQLNLKYSMTQLKKDKNALGGLSDDDLQKSLSISEDREGREPDFFEITTFDLSRLQPGEYELTVRVEDLISGATVQRSTRLRIR